MWEWKSPRERNGVSVVWQNRQSWNGCHQLLAAGCRDEQQWLRSSAHNKKRCIRIPEVLGSRSFHHICRIVWFSKPQKCLFRTVTIAVNSRWILIRKGFLWRNNVRRDVCLLSILVCLYASFMDPKDFISKTSFGHKASIWEHPVRNVPLFINVVLYGFRIPFKRSIQSKFGVVLFAKTVSHVLTLFNHVSIRMYDSKTGPGHRSIKTQN